MTVGQDVQGIHLKVQPDKFREYINQLREITGIKDDETLQRALNETMETNGTVNVSKALAFVLERQPDGSEDVKPPSPVTVDAKPSSENGVVDLTQDIQVQKALALSMEEHRSSTSSTSGTNTRPPGVTQEDQDVSKALEASLMESNKRRRSHDNGNPEERKRDETWPVGLKNVGQTCWFSAVIQSFFHLPAFRILVLNFKPPQREPSDNKERKILDFMLELRKLFSLLVGSHKKYVDPSCAVDILRGCLGGAENHSNNQQQDVSEFTHRLLDWLEEAFKIRDKYNRPPAASSKEQQAMDIEVEKCDKEKEVETNTGGEGVVVKEEVLPGSTGSTGSEEATTSNPMFDLFYGKVKIEGKNQGNEFIREEQFGQLPLQVNNFTNIHDSLEASTAHEHIHACSQSDLQTIQQQQLAVRKSGQERWFTKLPPVLFFELSRFQYNQEKRMAEKVNDFLDFPEVIHMDRYIEINKQTTRLKREQVKKLKEQKDKLNRQLQSYLQYGAAESAAAGSAGCSPIHSSSHNIPLVNILSSTLQFARSGVPSTSAACGGGGGDTFGGDGDVEGKSPAPSSHSMQVDSPCSSPVSLTPASSTANLSTVAATTQTTATTNIKLKTLPDGLVQIPIRIEGATPPNTANGDNTGPGDQPTPMEVETDDLEHQQPTASAVASPMASEASVSGGDVVVGDNNVIVPAPKHISEVELKVLSSCLLRWRKEIEDELAILQAALEKVEERISTMYTSSDIQQHEYRLHAVMVHEGDVNQGHYWAYVYHPEKKVWLKFNDNTVSESSNEGMRTESVGGRTSTSAYSLIYIDASRPDLFKTEDALGMNKCLPEDLEQYVLGDNKAFATEMLNWKEEQLNLKHEMEMNEAGKVLIGDDPEVQIIETKNDLKKSHAVLAQTLVTKVLKENIKMDSSRSLGQVKDDILNQVGDKNLDEGLDNFLSYLILVSSSREVLSRALAEHIVLPNQDISNSNQGRQWIQEARDELRSNGNFAEATWRLHRAYHSYRIACYYFVLGVERYNENKYEEAVDLLTTAYIVNDKVLKEELACNNHAGQGIPTRGLIKYFHLGVESLNSRLVQEFQSKANPREVSACVSKVLVPAIHLLQHRTNHEADPTNRDAALLETVRGRWCALLETPMPAEKHEHWSAVFNKVVPDDNSVIMKEPANPRYPNQADDQNLATKFRNIMQTVLNEDR